MKSRALNKILKKHELYLNHEIGGKQARFEWGNKNLSGHDFSHCDLRKAQFERCELKSSVFCATDLRDANFLLSNLTGANLSGANLSRVNFHGTTLKNVNFQGADLSYANLSDADARGADFTGANICNANFYDTNLKGAKIFETIISLDSVDALKVRATFNLDQDIVWIWNKAYTFKQFCEQEHGEFRFIDDYCYEVHQKAIQYLTAVRDLANSLKEEN